MREFSAAALHAEPAHHVFMVAGIGYQFDVFMTPDCSRYAATIGGGPGGGRLIAETIDITAASFRQICSALVAAACSDLAGELGEHSPSTLGWWAQMEPQA